MKSQAMQQHRQEMQQMHLRTLWVHFANIALGLWLAASPFLLGTFNQEMFPDAVLRVTEERDPLVACPAQHTPGVERSGKWSPDRNDLIEAFCSAALQTPIGAQGASKPKG